MLHGMGGAPSSSDPPITTRASSSRAPSWATTLWKAGERARWSAGLAVEGGQLPHRARWSAGGVEMVPDERGNQRSSAVIRGHQRGVEMVPDERGNQRSSAVIRGHQRSSEVIRGHHQRSSSAVISGLVGASRRHLALRRRPREIKGDQGSSRELKGAQGRWHLALRRRPPSRTGGPPSGTSGARAPAPSRRSHAAPVGRGERASSRALACRAERELALTCEIKGDTGRSREIKGDRTCAALAEPVSSSTSRSTVMRRTRSASSAALAWRWRACRSSTRALSHASCSEIRRSRSASIASIAHLMREAIACTQRHSHEECTHCKAEAPTGVKALV